MKIKDAKSIYYANRKELVDQMRSLTKQKEAPEDPMEVADNTEYGGELPDIEIPEVAGDMSSGDGIAE